MRSFLNGSANFKVDMSDVARTIDLLRGVLTREQMNRLLHRTFNEVGKRSKKIISDAVRQEYVPPVAWIKAGIGRYQLSMGGAGVECKIPLTSVKGPIGEIYKYGGGKRWISASIVRGGRSRLPAVMKNQGGNPPFIAKGRVLTRRTQERYPIVRVVALADPQMPLNRSADETQDQLLDLTGRRLEHNFMHMFGSGR